MSDIPIDTATGMQSGPAVHLATVEVLVGYLVTHADGYQVRMDTDRARVGIYAARNHATIEPMYVRRARQAGAGGPIGIAAMPG